MFLGTKNCRTCSRALSMVPLADEERDQYVAAWQGRPVSLPGALPEILAGATQAWIENITQRVTKEIKGQYHEKNRHAWGNRQPGGLAYGFKGVA